MSEVLIILIIFGAIFGKGIVRTYFSHREKILAIEMANNNAKAKGLNRELLNSVESLSERIEVLEKIITDEKYKLDRKIANL